MGNAFQCNSIFNDKEYDFLQPIYSNGKITESAIFEAAAKELIRSTETNYDSYLKNKFIRILESLNYNRNFRNELLLEVKRRDYRKLAEKLNIEITDDIPAVLKRNKHYFSTIFSLALNGSVNWFTYQFLGTMGYIVDIPKLKIFDPRKIPDDVLNELIDLSYQGQQSRKFISLHFKYGADYIWNTVSSYMAIGILIYLLIENHQMLTDPSGYLQDQLENSLGSINYAIYMENLKQISLIEKKISNLDPSTESQRIEKGRNLIANFERINNQIHSKTPSFDVFSKEK